MKALRYYSQRDFRLEDIPEPEPMENEVQVSVAYCGICGSDIHEYVHGLHGVPTKRPHPQTGKMAPIVGGHEFSGIIKLLGSGVTSFRVGDRVAVRPTLPCYNCSSCKSGRFSQCALLATIGVSADGAFAESVVVRSDCLHILAPSVTFEAATYAEPLACGVHAVKRSGSVLDAPVAIIGAGPIGLMTLQAAKAAGAAAVYVFDTSPQRRNFARAVGATAVFDPGAVDSGKSIGALTGGSRASVVFECAGVPAAIHLADAVSGRGATIVMMGMMSEPVHFSFLNLFLREKSMVASMGYDNEDYARALELIAGGSIRTDDVLTTSRIRLDEILTRGFDELTGPARLEQCKILVTPQ